MSGTQENLEGFEWDATSAQMDFFGETADNPLVKAEEEEHEISFEEDKEKKIKKVAKEEEEKEHSFSFEENEEEEEGEEEEEEAEKTAKVGKVEKTNSNKSVVSSAKSVMTFLQEKGLVTLPEGTDFEKLSDTEAEDQLEDSWESSKEDYLKETLKKLPATVRNLIKIASDEGDVEGYLAKLAKESKTSLSADLDMDDEANQESALRKILAEEGVDANDIDDQIEFLKDKDRLEATSKRRFNKWLEKKEEADTNAVNAAKTAKTEAKAKIRENRDKIADLLSKSESISSLPISKEDIKDLPDYITAPAYDNTSNGTTISEFQKDLFEALKDQEKLVTLAKLLKSGFDFSSIEDKGASDATKKIKDKLHNQDTGGATQKRTKRIPTRLVDMIDD